MNGHFPDEPVQLIPEDMYVQRASEHARHELVLDNIRGHLAEQPTANSVQAAARHWCADITAAADEIAHRKRSPA